LLRNPLPAGPSGQHRGTTSPWNDGQLPSGDDRGVAL